MKTSRTNNHWVYAAPSNIEGQGLFARREIPAGTPIVEYAGPRLSADEGRARLETGNVYIFRANRREHIDGSVTWNLARYANHSCAPNAKSVNRGGAIWLIALREVLKGEEITYNYGYSMRDEPVTCRCGSAGCIGRI